MAPFELFSSGMLFSSLMLNDVQMLKRCVFICMYKQLLLLYGYSS